MLQKPLLLSSYWNQSIFFPVSISFKLLGISPYNHDSDRAKGEGTLMDHASSLSQGNTEKYYFITC
jgi:hypothetical protein